MDLVNYHRVLSGQSATSHCNCHTQTAPLPDCRSFTAASLHRSCRHRRKAPVLGLHSACASRRRSSCQPRARSNRTQAAASAAEAPPAPVKEPEIRGVGEVADVESLDGVRVKLDEDTNRPFVEYLVKWKDGAASSWEPKVNLAENMLRDFEDRWWKCCRDAKAEDMDQMLRHSAIALSNVTDSNRRSGLHFVAAAGNADCTQMLCEAGADVNFADKEGFTPLHMAVGYSHTESVKVLLDHGASPDACDRQGRSVAGLVDDIRQTMPVQRETIGRRIALEQVANLLAASLYEEAEPEQLLKFRGGDAAAAREFLVKWADGHEDSWVRESDLAEDLVKDYDSELEYADAKSIQRMRLEGEQRFFLVEWSDGHERTWEPEANLTKDLVAAFEQEQSAKGIAMRGSDTDDSQATSSSRGRSQGGARIADDADSASGEERYRVVSFGDNGAAREEAFVATLEQARDIAGEGDVIQDTEAPPEASPVHGNGASANGSVSESTNANGKAAALSGAIAPPEAAG